MDVLTEASGPRWAELSSAGYRADPGQLPQARGRCEQLYGTFQGRLPQEPRLRGIGSMEAANRFLRETYALTKTGQITCYQNRSF